MDLSSCVFFFFFFFFFGGGGGSIHYFSPITILFGIDQQYIEGEEKRKEERERDFFWE